MSKLRTYQEQLQDIVDKGINAAEAQQKKLAAKPFDYAEKLESEARAYSVKTLRKHYNGYSESVFEQLRSLNSRVGSFAADLVAKLEKDAADSADMVSETAEEVSEAAQDAKQAATSKPAESKKPEEGKKSKASNKPAASKKTAASKQPAASKTTASETKATASSGEQKKPAEQKSAENKPTTSA